MSGPRYSIIPADALDDSRVTDLHLRVLSDFGRAADRNGWLQANQSLVAKRLGRSRETINRTIRDLVEWGYLRKKQRFSGRDGRQMINDYQVMMDRAERAEDEGCPQPEMEDLATPCDPDITGGVTPEDHTPCDLQTSHHRNDPLLQRPSSSPPGKEVEREARAREPEDRKAVERSFDRAWREWPVGSTGSRDEAFAAWCRLAPEERAAAKAAIGRWIAANKASGRDYLPALSRYLAERRWEGLPPEEPSRPENAMVAAKPFGKAFMARRFSMLIDGPSFTAFRLTPFEIGMVRDGKADEAEILRAKQASTGFPSVLTMDQSRGASVPEPIAALGEAFTQARRGDDRFEAWTALHAARGWPWIPDWVEWVWLPPGDPGLAMAEFEAALRDGGETREAAE